jgi:hypothetical protein
VFHFIPKTASLSLLSYCYSSTNQPLLQNDTLFLAFPSKSLSSLNVFQLLQILKLPTMVACSYCGRDFLVFPALFNHQRSTGHCFCRVCIRHFDTEASLALHNEGGHRKPLSISVGAERRTEQGDHQTLSISKGIEIPPIPPPGPHPQPKKSWVCTLCDRSLLSKKRLNDHCSVPHPHKCGACSKAYIVLRALHAHNRSAKHCFCRQCDQCFQGPEALAQHLQAVIHAAHFHCCDCDRDFLNQQALDQHLEFKDHASIRNRSSVKDRLVAKDHSSLRIRHECTKCRREFIDQAALKKHLASLIHNPLSKLECIASSKCKRQFNSPSALIHHLESGTCCSGLTRTSLNQLILSNDTDCLISSGLQDPDILMGLQHRLSLLTITTNPIRTPDSSEDSTPIMTPATDDGSGVMLSPYLGRISSTLPLSSDVSAMQAPIPRANGLFCPLCPQRPKPFKSLASLHMHLASPKHAPKVFHCPSSIFPPGKAKKRHQGSIQHFSTLSGLTQHIESAACRGGKATLQKAIELVEKRLGDMGFDQVRLLE